MSDKNYKRTSGYRNWINRRIFIPMIVGGVAYFSDHAKYEIRKDGWRELLVATHSGG